MLAPLQLGPLTRADHGSRVTCMAAFHQFSSALSTAVVIRMLCEYRRGGGTAGGVPQGGGDLFAWLCQWKENYIVECVEVRLSLLL